MLVFVEAQVSPWQHYLEGPPHLANMTVRGNTFTACGGVFGAMHVNCSGLNNGTNLPTIAGQFLMEES